MIFEEFKPIPRLFRDCTISEKIDGTNGQIKIEEWPNSPGDHEIEDGGLCIFLDGVERGYRVMAGSRSRYVTPGKSTDNHGFAKWVFENAEGLIATLGIGLHFGEWWGSGIQRGYGLANGSKRFSLFNPRWDAVLKGREIGGLPIPPGLGVVPVMYEGPFLTREIEDQIFRLRTFGSLCSPGFMDPEGVVVYHHAAKAYFKTTIKDDEKGKGFKDV